MSTFPRGRRTRDDAIAVAFRFLLALVLATSLSYCSVAVDYAKALLTWGLTITTLLTAAR